jgi:hypothetical protein
MRLRANPQIWRVLDPLEAEMRWIEKQARYYQGYLADKRSLIPVTILLANAVAIWLLTYLIGSVGDPSQPHTSLSPPPSASAILQRVSDEMP